MKLKRNFFSRAGDFFAATAMIAAGMSALGQVSPTEVQNPRAKADELKYMPQLVSLQRSIGTANFPFTFRLARYLDAKPGQRAALDSNGLEFVYFQGRVVLKVSGFYRVAFNSMQTTPNGRAGQTLEQAVLPILQLITEQVPQNYDYDAIGFEILYDARDSSGAYDYEGHEVLTAVFNRDEAFALASAATNEMRQEILSRSDVFVNGKQFELTLGQHDPMEAHPVQRPPAQATLQRTSFSPAKTLHPALAASAVSPDVSDAQPVRSMDARSSDLDAAGLQTKLQGEVSAIRDGDEAKSTRFVEDAPSLETSGDQRMLHFTMQNTLSFPPGQTSIYKRAAQSFDLFLAPELKEISNRVPTDAGVNAMHFSVLSHVGVGKDEIIEYICPMDSMRSFVENKITTQELINKSMVLVNGVRIGLDLQLVE
jgi:hypothetical protein